MMVACLTYGVTIVNDPPLQIHFPDGTLVPQFNWAFWLVLATGCLTALAAIVIVFIDKRSPRMTAEFFHHSTIEDHAIFQDLGMVKEISKYHTDAPAGKRPKKLLPPKPNMQTE